MKTYEIIYFKHSDNLLYRTFQDAENEHIARMLFEGEIKKIHKVERCDQAVRIQTIKEI